MIFFWGKNLLEQFVVAGINVQYFILLKLSSISLLKIQEIKFSA